MKLTLDYTCYKKLSEKRKKRKICFRNILLEFEGLPLSAIFKNINIFPNIYYTTKFLYFLSFLVQFRLESEAKFQVSPRHKSETNVIIESEKARADRERQYSSMVEVETRPLTEFGSVDLVLKDVPAHTQERVEVKKQSK